MDFKQLWSNHKNNNEKYNWQGVVTGFTWIKGNSGGGGECH